MIPRKIQPAVPDFPDLSFENDLWDQSYALVAGLDEAGRGPWAGPVVAAAVILPQEPEIALRLQGVTDSKKLSAASRTLLAEKIKHNALTWGIGFASAQEIDCCGIVQATRLAMQRSLDALSTVPDHLLLDYMRLPENSLPQLPLVKGDARSLSIAAASILAKTSRDRWMIDVDLQFPQYGFKQHKGYGTQKHRQALDDFGPCEIHRKSFRPILKYY